MATTNEMRTLLEIKAQLSEINTSGVALKALNDINALANASKAELQAKTKEYLGALTKNSKRLLKYVVDDGFVASYQEVKRSIIDDSIVKYGDVYIKGVKVSLHQNAEFIEVYGGINSYYAVPKTGNFIYVWGKNSQGCCGAGHTRAIMNPSFIEFQARVTNSTTNASALVLLENGEVFAAGDNSCGQLGTGNTIALSTFTKIAVSNIVDIVMNCHGSVVSVMMIDNKGQVFVQGYNGNGYLGTGNTANVLRPTKINLPRPVKKAYLGSIYSHNYQSNALVLLDNGEVYGCGINDRNHLSQISDLKNKTTFVPLYKSASKEVLDNIKELFVGSYLQTSYALDNDNNLWAWGDGYYGFGDTDYNRNAYARKTKNFVSRAAGTFNFAGNNLLIIIERYGFLYYQGNSGLGVTGNMKYFYGYTVRYAQDFEVKYFNTQQMLVVLQNDQIYTTGNNANANAPLNLQK